ncbi:hypothetical protein, partial [Actinocrispum wychmicini]
MVETTLWDLAGVLLVLVPRGIHEWIKHERRYRRLANKRWLHQLRHPDRPAADQRTSPPTSTRTQQPDTPNQRDLDHTPNSAPTSTTVTQRT